jgi:phosphopantetheinyl transferase
MSFWSWPSIHHYQLTPHQLHLWFFIFPEKSAQLKLMRKHLLLKILNHYTQMECIKLEHNPQGKPFVFNHSLQFNLSHSKNFMLLGLQQVDPLGLDLESLHPRDISTFAEYFWGKEWYLKELDRCPDYLKLLGFYHAWTQTEAWVKYHGATVFRHPPFHPKPLPPPMQTFINNEKQLQLISFMPQPGLCASICTPKNIQTLATKTIDLNDPKQAQIWLADLEGYDAN